MRLAVFGAGAIGSFLAASLVDGRHWVGVVARGTQLDVIRRAGIQVQAPHKVFHAMPSHITDHPEEIGHVDAVLLGVKAWQVQEAANAMRPLIGPATKVLTLQNGVEAPNKLAEVLGGHHVLIGVARIVVLLVSPGCVQQARFAPTIAIAEYADQRPSQNTLALINALRCTGIAAEVTHDSRAALWGKLVFIAGLSGIGAIARSTVGEIRQCAPTRDLLRAAMNEVAAVAAGAGVDLNDDAVERSLELIDDMPAAATGSMHRDIVAGRPSELEAIIGAVIRVGGQHTVPTPALDVVYAALVPQETRARDHTQRVRA